MAEMTHKTLKHEMIKYLNVSEDYVQNIINEGTSGSVAHLVAHILGIKKCIPEGYDPFSSMIKPSCHKMISSSHLRDLKYSFAKKTPRKRWSQEELDAIQLLLDSNISHEVIGDILNRTVKSVKAIIKKRLDF